MTESKHTPVPWIIEHGDWIEKGHAAISSKDHGSLATVVWIMEDDEIDGKNSPVCEANARIIAAAPELLEALQQGDQIDDLHRKMHRIEKRRNRGSFGIAVADDEDAIEWQKLSSEVEILISKRNAVIAKATGA